MPLESFEELAATLRARLGPGSASLPGARAHARMAPRPRRTREGPGGGYVDAAVLVLLYPTAKGASLVLTRRTDTVGSHRSQISLPGGKREEGESLEEAALRECAEELAVDGASVALAGRLSPLEIPVSGFCIHPLVGFAPGRPGFVPDPSEVAEVIEVTLGELASSVREETWDRDGFRQEVPFYLVSGHAVWGATAMILSELLAVALEGA
jgi:8-oxo-dGTP pyrophosphatase MutT (NUDIX family)